MAAHGGAAAVAELGNQIFVTLRKGKEYPPKVVNVRVKYEQTILELKQAVEQKAGVPIHKQQLFHNRKELTAAYNAKTLMDLHLHTGFSLNGYDLTEPPDYFPEVTQTPEGLLITPVLNNAPLPTTISW